MSINGRGQRVESRGLRGARCFWSRAIVVCVILLGTPGVAQPAPEAEPAGPAVELLLEQMLSEDRVLSETLTGVAWDVSASPGRRLMQLPLSIKPGQEEGLIEEPRISFGGSRFVGWWLPIEEQAAAPRGRSRRNTTVPAPTDQELLDLAGLLDHLEVADSDARARGGERFGDLDATGGAGGALLPEGAPRLARAIRVKPDGRVAWEVARLIPGATVKSGETPYLLYLDGQRLRELKPEKETVTRNNGESSREFSQRRREIDIAYREELTAYRELQQSSRNVPTLLEADLPEVVWAVFEVNAVQDEWTLRGGPAGTWSMGFSEFEALRALAGGQGISSWPEQGGGAFSTEDRRLINMLDELAKSRHPWSQRMLARALADSGYAANIGMGDAVSDVFTRLLASEDLIARNRTVYALATTDPATPATASLLEEAAKNTGDPAVQLAALRSQLAVQVAASSPQRGARDAPVDLSGVVATVNANLANPTGADAGLVIKQLLTTVRAETPEAVSALVNGVRFAGLPPERFDAAVAAVLSSAGTQPQVVGGWVDRQLLGSSDADTVKRTLELMASADAPAPAVSAFAAALRGAVFGRPEAAPEDTQASGASEEAPLPSVTMTAGLPLDSTNHALFKLLNSGDAEKRKAGWSVLRHFELTDREPTRGRRSAPTEDAEDALTMIVDAGLGQADTPSSLVPFLLRQPDEARANGPLLRVILTGDNAASRRAARALLGSGRELGLAVGELESESRSTLGNTVYDRVGDGPEPVTGLLRQDSNRRGGTANWFGDAWAAGELPEAAEWAEPAGGDSALLRLVGGEDETLAQGAIAALAAVAGADRATQLNMIDRFTDQRQTLSAQELEEAWGDAKKDIYTQRLASAAGEYRLTMVVSGDEDAGQVRDPYLGYDSEAAAAQAQAAAGDAARVERTVLGVVTLDADGRSVSFGGGTPTLSVPEDRLALRIAEPGQLLAYADEFESLQGLPLDGIDEPLDLLPQDNGVWAGQVPMPDGRVFGLQIEPRSSTSEDAADDAPEKDSATEKAEG